MVNFLVLLSLLGFFDPELQSFDFPKVETTISPLLYLPKDGLVSFEISLGPPPENSVSALKYRAVIALIEQDSIKIQSLLNKNSATVEFSSTDFRSLIKITAPKDNFDDVISSVFDVLLKPRFNQSELKQIRKRWIWSREQAWLSQKRLLDAAESLVTWGTNGLVPTEDYKLNKKTLKKAHRNLLNSGAFFTLVGPVKPDLILPYIENFSKPYKYTCEAPDLDPELLLIDDFGPGRILMSLKAPGSDSPDYPIIRIISWVFAESFLSRSNTTIREEKAYSYGISGSVRSWPCMSRIKAQTFTSYDDSSEILLLLMQELDLLGQKGLSQRELDQAKSAILLQSAKTTFSSTKLANELSMGFMLTQNPNINQIWIDKISKVTLEEVNSLTAKIAKSSLADWIIVGDRDIIEPGLDQKGLTPTRIVSSKQIVD